MRTGFGRRGPLFIRVWFTLVGFLLLTPEKGADTAIWLASSPAVEGASGGYYDKRKLAKPDAAARDSESAKRLWELSEELTGLQANEKLGMRN